MWWEIVSCCLTGVTKTAFAKLCSLVRLVYLAVSVDLKRRQLPEEADYTVHQILRCSAGVDLVHQQTVCTWSCLQLLTSGVASEQVSRGPVDEGQEPDELPRFELVVAVRLLYAVVQLAKRYNSPDAKRWMVRRAMPWHLCQLVVWFVSVCADGRSHSLLPLWDAAS